MKPFILICGAPHSLTSMISKFIQDNGAVAPAVWDNPNYDIPYSRYEDKEIWKYMDSREKFRNHDLTNYFASLPVDKVAVAKEPGMVFFINELRKFTCRPIKVVFVIRNPEQTILSSLEKSSKSFIFYFERMSWMYQFIIDCKFDLFILMSERIKIEGRRLLEFCELPSSYINFNSMKEIQIRKKEINTNRFHNLIWFHLSRLFAKI